MSSGKSKESASSNPLLINRELPAFDDIQVKHIEPALDEVLRDNRVALKEVEVDDSAPTWNNTFACLEKLDDRLNKMWSPVSHLNAVKDSEALREVYEKCLPKLSAYGSEISQNEKLFARAQALADSKEYENLNAAQKKTVDNAVRDFRLGGVALPQEQKDELTKIQSRLSDLSNQFSQNVLDATDGWYIHVTDEQELAGLPESTIAMAKQSAEKSQLDGWKLTLQAPSFVPVMTFADDAKLREQMYWAYTTRASEQGPNASEWDNGKLMPEILELRTRKAELLGFANYAEYSLATKMASSVDEVENFLIDLAGNAKAAAKNELKEIQDFAEREFDIQDLNAWDLGYYAEKLRQNKYEFSQEDVRPYFPVSKVLDGMFEVVGRLFGIRVEEKGVEQKWHKDARFFEIRDQGDQLRGCFFVDLFARERKRGGAWMADCVGRMRINESVQTPVAFLTCNFSPPVGEKPALLTHDEVTTLFHEFGHGLHHMLTQVDNLSVSGINGVAWDAVELPSQFLENWCWEREALDLISGHHETGKSLPDTLLNKMRDARNFQAAMQMLRQVEFALFDWRLHCTTEKQASSDIQKILGDVRSEVSVVIPPVFNRFQNSFAHIFAGGYAAGYYSYKWAEVLSADAFSRFEEEGIFNPDTGRDFRAIILEQGGSREPLELFVEFRGRKPSNDALLRHSGLAA